MSKRDQRKAFGQAVKAARERRELTQQELAAAVGVRRNMVSQWETGLAGASEDRVEMLERVLDVEQGRLGQHLGFAPAQSGSFAAAVETDPDLTDEARRMLLAAYEAAKMPERP